MKFEFELSESEPLIREVVGSGGEFTFFPRGTSMLPLIRQGRDAVVLRAFDRPLRKGDVPLYRRDDGHYILHRVVGVAKDGTYTMCGDNQTAREPGIREEQVIALLCAVVRKGKRVNVTDGCYRRYVFFWRSFFLRRVFFFCRKVKGKLFGKRREE